MSGEQYIKAIDQAFLNQEQSNSRFFNSCASLHRKLPSEFGRPSRALILWRYFPRATLRLPWAILDGSLGERIGFARARFSSPLVDSRSVDTQDDGALVDDNTTSSDLCLHDPMPA